MATTAAFEIRGRIDGMTEGVNQVFLPITLTSSAGGLKQSITLTTAAAAATSFVASGRTKLLLIIPPTTNTVPWRLAGSTSDVGVQMSSILPALIPVTTGFVFSAYTTGGTTLGGFTVIEY